MEEFKKVVTVQDDDSHWFVIPIELKDQFMKDLESGEADEWETFTARYDAYATGGDLNNVQLFAKI